MSQLDARERHELNQLRRKVKKLESSSHAVQADGGGAGVAGGGPQHDVKPERVRRLGKLRSEIKKLEGVDGAETILESKRQEARQLDRELAATKPTSVQLSELERKQKDQKSTTEALANKIAATDKQITELQAHRLELEGKHTQSQTCEKELQALIDNLLAQQLRERDAQQQEAGPRGPVAPASPGANLSEGERATAFLAALDQCSGMLAPGYAAQWDGQVAEMRRLARRVASAGAAVERDGSGDEQELDEKDVDVILDSLEEEAPEDGAAAAASGAEAQGEGTGDGAAKAAALAASRKLRAQKLLQGLRSAGIRRRGKRG